ncbi:hypothetical protein E2C01_067067 [Portunus trituberculatus]|uniref:Uncharacterized protein n=1 Tax=Portunus trituberculatus TaxID=210409 RepID=A0A5B7HWH5_PORTR|nr:hypothetical protein [Portunus trituberculatus]
MIVMVHLARGTTGGWRAAGGTDQHAQQCSGVCLPRHASGSWPQSRVTGHSKRRAVRGWACQGDRHGSLAWVDLLGAGASPSTSSACTPPSSRLVLIAWRGAVRRARPGLGGAPRNTPRHHAPFPWVLPGASRRC